MEPSIVDRPYSHKAPRLVDFDPGYNESYVLCGVSLAV